ncbi:MAG: DUF790 family protein, partial [bacterium]
FTQEEFAEKLGEGRDGWTLVREGTPVDLGEELLLPDFTLRHEDGREALVEIVGFWTPEYLEKKVRRVAAAGRDDLLLVVYRDLGAGAEGSKREAGGKGAGDDRLGSEGTGGEFGGGPPEDTPEGGPEYPSEDAPEGGPDDALERAFPGRVLRFARKPVIRDVMEAVERVAR